MAKTLRDPQARFIELLRRYDSRLGAVERALRLGGGSSGPKITTSPFADGPPEDPADGDIWIATQVHGSKKRWQFSYDADEATAYKWKFIGGPKYAALSGATFQNSAANVWEQRGPALAVVRGGYYEIDAGAILETTNSGNNVYFGVANNGAFPYPYTFRIVGYDNGGADWVPVSIGIDSEYSGTVWTPGQTIATYMQSAAPSSVAMNFPWIKVSPVAVA